MGLLRLCRRWIRGVVFANADRLWLRYLIGFVLLVLIVGAGALGQRQIGAAERSAAQAISLAAQHPALIRQIIALAPAARDGDAQGKAAIGTAADQLRRAHGALRAMPGLPDGAAAILGTDESMPHRQVLSFVDLAEALAGNDDATAAVAYPALVALGAGDMSAAFTSLALPLAQGAAALRARNMFWQRLLLAGQGLAGLALVLAVFLPAHLSVRRALGKLRQRSYGLQKSRERLCEANAALNRVATQDVLTKLPNRAALMAELQNRLDDQSEKFSLILIDIFRFRMINDSFGHPVGDALLVMVAGALKNAIDADGYVARIGGDEFAILTARNPQPLAQKLADQFALPVRIEGRTCQTGLCVGYAITRKEGREAVGFFGNADMALQHAMRDGRCCTVGYTPALRMASLARTELLAELPGALDQIVPYYQPQISLSHGGLSGVEVLARWQHPRRGLLPPGDFLPLATQAGLARDIDYALWSVALRQMQRWRQAGIHLPRISLNAAPDTIADPRVVNQIVAMVSMYGLSNDAIAIEVLENTFIGSVLDTAAINIDRLTNMGIMVELDDFGTGYTSLATLMNLNLAGIKLDRSLISPLPGRNAQTIVRAVLALAEELGLHVVAEGIETGEQAEFLAESGCDAAQGFAIGMPMTEAEFTTWLKVWNAQSGDAA